MTTTYTRTAAQVIKSALFELKVISLTETVDSNLEAECLVRLNAMIKQDQIEGVKLWRRRFAKLFLVASQRAYDLPGANACNLDELHETTLDADEAASQTVLSVTSTSGFTNSDNIGILLDDNTIHWTTISSFVANDTVTIASGLPSGASSGSKVFVYTTALARPLSISTAQRELSDNEIPMEELEREEYEFLPNKSSTGAPVNFYYDPQIATGKLYLWPAPDSAAQEINFTYIDELQVITDTSNSYDYPQEWLEYLIYNLAIRVSSLTGKEPKASTIQIAANAKNRLMAWDGEGGSVEFCG